MRNTSDALYLSLVSSPSPHNALGVPGQHTNTCVEKPPEFKCLCCHLVGEVLGSAQALQTVFPELFQLVKNKGVLPGPFPEQFPELGLKGIFATATADEFPIFLHDVFRCFPTPPL